MPGVSVKNRLRTKRVLRLSPSALPPPLAPPRPRPRPRAPLPASGAGAIRAASASGPRRDRAAGAAMNARGEGGPSLRGGCGVQRYLGDGGAVTGEGRWGGGDLVHGGDGGFGEGRIGALAAGQGTEITGVGRGLPALTAGM